MFENKCFCFFVVLREPLDSEKRKEFFVNWIPLTTVATVTPSEKQQDQFTIIARDKKKGNLREYKWRIHGKENVEEVLMYFY